MQTPKSTKGIVEMLNKSQLFFHTSEEKDSCKVRLCLSRLSGFALCVIDGQMVTQGFYSSV